MRMINEYPENSGTAFPPPTLVDAGPVARVTLGRNGFDRRDATEYREKTPGVSAL